MTKAISEKGIKASIIGKITKGEKFIISGGEKSVLSEPGTDELYRV